MKIIQRATWYPTEHISKFWALKPFDITKSRTDCELVSMGTASMYVLNPCMSKPAACVQEAALGPNPSLQ